MRYVFVELLPLHFVAYDTSTTSILFLYRDLSYALVFMLMFTPRNMLTHIMKFIDNTAQLSRINN